MAGQQACEKEYAHVIRPRILVTRFRRNIGVLLCLCMVALGHQASVQAAPQLTVPPAGQLEQAFQTGKSYTLRLEYKDANGDTIAKKNAVFVDESSTGTQKYTATDIDGADSAQGETIAWQINGFNPGGHQGYFEVTPLTGKAVRYPADPGTFYSFTVESVATKFITLGFGILVGLGVIPFISYFLFRTVNKRGDPSRAARVGLFFGILAVIALFLFLFTGVISPLLLYAIPIIALVAGLIVIFGRR